MKKLRGIYSIVHTASGRAYIGSSKNIKSRWSYHKTYLKRNKHPNCALQNYVNKYGLDSFEFTILEIVTEDINLKVIENNYMIKFGIGIIGSNKFNHDKGFNTQWAGMEGCVDPTKYKKGKDHHLYGKPGPNKGKIFTEEVRRNMSEGQLGKKYPNKILTNEPKANVSKGKKNIPWSQARRDAQNNKNK